MLLTFDSAFGLKILCQSNACNRYKLPFDEKFHRKIVLKKVFEIFFFRSRPALPLMLSQVHQNVAYIIYVAPSESLNLQFFSQIILSFLLKS